MPSTSKKQHNFMEAIAHSPSFAKKVGVPQSVGKDFSTADKGKTFKRGGDMATKKMNPFAKFEASAKDKAMDKKEMGMKKGGGVKKMAAGGFTRAADGIAAKGKTKAKQIVMAGNKAMKKGGMC
jgi:hypothetical protein